MRVATVNLRKTVKRPIPYLVFVTAPDLKTARGLAQAALKAKLAACVNLVPRLESHYWWHDKIETGAEVLMLFKTTAACRPRLQKLVLEKHPYDNPEFLAVKMDSGSPPYLNWIVSSVA
jgi:periplasmic divalent cation tolerance protein